MVTCAPLQLQSTIATVNNAELFSIMKVLKKCNLAKFNTTDPYFQTNINSVVLLYKSNTRESCYTQYQHGGDYLQHSACSLVLTS